MKTIILTEKETQLVHKLLRRTIQVNKNKLKTFIDTQDLNIEEIDNNYYDPFKKECTDRIVVATSAIKALEKE